MNTRRGSHAALPIRTSSGHVVGIVEGDLFKKSVHASKHFLRRPAAICFDVGTLDQAEAVGAVLVEVTDIESGRTYRASITKIRERGFSVNRGFGRQVGLPLEEFALDGEPCGLQLSFLLFGGAR